MLSQIATSHDLAFCNGGEITKSNKHEPADRF